MIFRYLHLLAMACSSADSSSWPWPSFRACGGAIVKGFEPSLGASGGRLGRARVLLVTGAWMASEYSRWEDPTLHVKLALVVLAGVLIVWHLRASAAHWLQGAIFLVSLVIVWLGLALAH